MTSTQQMTSPEAMSVVYNEPLTDLKAAIIEKFGSLKKLSEETGLDRFNLSRLFSKENPREMSVGTFVTICDALGLIEASSLPLETRRSLISLKQYLEIDNNAILRNILLIRFL